MRDNRCKRNARGLTVINLFMHIRRGIAYLFTITGFGDLIQRKRFFLCKQIETNFCWTFLFYYLLIINKCLLTHF